MDRVSTVSMSYLKSSRLFILFPMFQVIPNAIASLSDIHFEIKLKGFSVTKLLLVFRPKLDLVNYQHL